MTKNKKSKQKAPRLFAGDSEHVHKKAKQEQSLSSSIFGNSASSTSTGGGLFASESKWEELTKERQSKNKRKLFTNTTTTSSEKNTSNNDKKSAKDIIASRKKLIKATEKLIKSVSIDAPNTSADSSDDESIDEETQRGIHRIFVGRCDTTFRQTGVLILKNLFAKELVDKLHTKASRIETKLRRRLDEEGKVWQAQDDSKSRVNLQMEQDHAFQYHEVASRCLGRLDSRYQMDKAPFNSDQVIRNPLLMPLIHSLLGPAAKLVYAGLIISSPGSADQPWHQDGEALFGESPDVGNLPPYALNVFVPLQPVTPELGPTEFWVGSHTETSCQAIMKQLQNGDTSSDQIIGPLLQTGDVLLYDYRICHRGTSNLSEKMVRPMLYLMYSRPWFHEHLNFGSERLFPKKDKEG